MGFKMNISKRTSSNEDVINVENGESLNSNQLLSAVALLIGKPEPATENNEAINVTEAVVSQPENVETPKEKVAQLIIPTIEKVKPEPTIAETPKEVPKSRQVELIGSKTSGFPVAEKLKEKLDVQVYVDCSECGYKGDGSVIPKFVYMRCPYCREKLYLEQTTDIRGELDENGDAFVAHKKFLTREERWNYEQEKKQQSEEE